MPQIKEILEIEKDRCSIEQCARIHLFQEGTFYRAYEWSAWLCIRYFAELKITHRVLKGGEDLVFVGFPLTSLERYTPIESVVIKTDDKRVDMELPMTVFPQVVDVDSLRNDFSNWKQSQPLTEASKKREIEKSHTERNAHPRLSDVMLRIVAYPIEQHSPLECMSFLADIKQQISELL